MGWLKRTFGSTIGTKMLVGLTGLGLIGFIIMHMIGNLFIYADGGQGINEYAKGLHAVPGFTLLELGLLGLFVLHIGLTIRLVMANRAAKGGKYAVSASKRKEGIMGLLASKTMALSGITLLVFLVVHITDVRLRRGAADADGNHLYDGQLLDQLLFDTLSNPMHATLYAVGSLIVAWHVSHGLQSAFRSLGFTHPDVTPMLNKASAGLAVLLGVGFASIPLWIAFFR